LESHGERQVLFFRRFISTVTEEDEMKRIIALLIVALSAAAAAQADDPFVVRAAAAWNKKDGDAVIAAAVRESPASVPIVTGIVRHNLAVADPRAWAASAIEALTSAAKGGDPIAIAYQGSALTLRAGLKSAAGDVAGASADLEAGFTLLDKAVQKAPDILTLRFLRAENAASTSEQSPFNRWDIAAQDAADIDAHAALLSKAELASLELLKARIALGKGNTEEGLRGLEAAIKLDPGSRTAETARAMLADLEE
jgi:hypothetical protein